MQLLRVSLFFYVVKVFCMEAFLCKMNMTLYRQMPPLYQFDDFDDCMEYNAGTGVYCLAYAEVDTLSRDGAVARAIDKISKDSRRHYRHDHLFFGVCLDKCQNYLVDNNVQMENFFLPQITDEELINFYADLRSDKKRNFTESVIIHKCLSKRFLSNYGLELRTYLEYCEHKNSNSGLDTWCIVFIGIVALLFLLVVASSFFDYRLEKQKNASHGNDASYKSRSQDSTHSMLIAFSLRRNFNRLTRAPTFETEKNLQFFNGLRVIGVFLVIMAHIVVVFTTLPIQNPEFLEQSYHRIESVFMQNGCAILQIFFVISGFLLYINFVQRQVVTESSTLKHCVGAYFRALTYRILRILPSIAFLLLFTATLLTRMQSGPFWRHLSEAEETFCRRYWWKNLFLINNSVLMRTSCLHHTWYLAADMQLFEIFLLVLIVISKYPILKHVLFTCLLILAFLLPALATYLFKLDAFFAQSPENYRYLYFKDSPTFYLSYIPFYGNIGGYLFGIWLSSFYVKNQTKRLSFDKKLWNFLWFSIFPFGFALIFSGYYLVAYDFEKPSLLASIYAGLIRNSIALLIGYAILGLCFKFGGFLYHYLCQPQFRLLARISYQSYLWHVVVIRVLVGYYRQPVYLNHLVLLTNVIAAFVLTNFVAFMVALIFEYPLAQLFRCLFIKNKVKPSRSQQSGEEMF